MQGIEICLTGGRLDAIDPVVEFAETEDEIVIHNGAYEYRYDKDEVEEWSFYEVEEQMRRKKNRVEKTKAFIQMEKTFAYYSQMRQLVIDLSQLQTTKLGNGDAAFVGAVDSEGAEALTPVDITRSEYAAIRRYLIRNRERMLRREGLL